MEKPSLDFILYLFLKYYFKRLSDYQKNILLDSI